MQGPIFLVGDKRRKTYLFALIEDMSRLTARAEFYSPRAWPLIYRLCARLCSNEGYPASSTSPP
ncbi:hypothetical protein DFAR_3360003 [Desulfarculales bacterium]